MNVKSGRRLPGASEEAPSAGSWRQSHETGKRRVQFFGCWKQGPKSIEELVTHRWKALRIAGAAILSRGWWTKQSRRSPMKLGHARKRRRAERGARQECQRFGPVVSRGEENVPRYDSHRARRSDTWRRETPESPSSPFDVVRDVGRQPEPGTHEAQVLVVNVLGSRRR